jgi:uncharacterized protein (DUF1499 family)
MSQQLKACPDSPNCVCSEHEDGNHEIAPLAFSGDPDLAWADVMAAVNSLPRTTIVESGAASLQAESRSLLFRFVDDLELRLDADAGVIHVRSASRVGYGDMGVNRRRVEQLRGEFTALQSKSR